MADVVLRADRLGKRYRINPLERNPTLRGSVERFFAAPVTRIRDAVRRPTPDELLWALRDVSFELERGRVLGIVGPNGSGKSTLLKILSRITDPTEGSAEVHGRLSSLLEVGTGFHPELTGRDNTFLNGAILGMRRSEVAAKFDSIVEFAGIERFIDTPVKRYSSGMYMRLAFSVAAHLEPDILLVDEVLAVGDAEFQKRSLGKMREATGEGRTVIFVSHNLGSIRTLCQQALLLEGGRVRARGDVDHVLSEYLSLVVEESPVGDIPERAPRIGTGDARFTRVELVGRDRRRLSQLYLGQPLVVVLTLDVRQRVSDALLEVGISTLDGTRISTSFSTEGGLPAFRLEPGEARVSVELEPSLLPGHFTVDLGVHHAGLQATIDFVERTYDFEVLNIAKDSDDRYPVASLRGYVRPRATWSEPEPTRARARDSL